MSESETVRKHKEYLFPAVSLYYPEPIAITKGEGHYVWDDQGNKYLDAFGGVLTVSIGHANPKVVAAIVDQVKKVSHTSTLYATEAQSNLAEKLAHIAPGNLKKSFFSSSGTEANETAVAAAKTYTGRTELVVLRHSYSGRSATTLAMCGQSAWKKVPNNVPGIHHAHAPYCYRCPFGQEYPSCGLKCAEDIEELILTETGGEIAAFFAETVIGAGGFIVPPPGYFEKAAGIARKYGGLFISDEVQAAWGRTGKHMFGISHWNVTPDILTSAKGMGNGTPIGLTIATPEVAAKYPGVTFATFGGNPVSCAAAHATIDYIESEKLVQNCATTGAYLGDQLKALKEKHPLIGDARGLGLMQALELVKDRKTKEPAPQQTTAVLNELKNQGVLIGKGGVYGNVLRTGLMLHAGKPEVDQLIAALDTSLTVAAKI
ncbi:MAG TPA: aspartate aminotransferase family protein [Tepidisphaeraceae bacterium]|jgi:4-aminobutyrate aminotransferase|nr:aspartate aminotransferase family protein [Tepidisphaeraceae bacterium]